MKNKLQIIILICLGLCIQGISYSQLNSIKFYTSYSIGHPDKRFDFLYDQNKLGLAQSVRNNIKKNTPDDEYSLGFGYSYSIKDRCRLNFDLGYTKLIQDFLLPANGTTYFGQVNEILYWRRKSEYHLIQISPGIDFIILDKDVRLGAMLQFIGNISFCKNIPEYNLTKKKIEYFATEMYPGVFAEYKSFRASLGIRSLHLKNRDDAIYNNGLKVDTHNPFKIRFTLSYRLLEW